MDALIKATDGPGHLELRDVPRPVIDPDELLLEVAYCGVCGSDLHIEAGSHPVDAPVTLGHEFSGTVAEVGADVSDFSKGDRVGYRRGWNPFPGVGSDGGFAQYMSAPADSLWQLPEDVTLQEATQFETVCTPMSMVHDTADLDEAERVVVSGPGPIGLLTVNVARMAGASSITVVGTEQDQRRRLPKAIELGADETLVFGEEAFAAIQATPPDVWFETAGAASAIEAAVDHVASGGRIVCSGLGEGPFDVDMHRVAYDNLSIRGHWGGEDSYIEPAVDAMISGEMKIASLITDIIPLADWQTVFEMARSQETVKVLLTPRDTRS